MAQRCAAEAVQVGENAESNERAHADVGWKRSEAGGVSARTAESEGERERRGNEAGQYAYLDEAPRRHQRFLDPREQTADADRCERDDEEGDLAMEQSRGEGGTGDELMTPTV